MGLLSSIGGVVKKVWSGVKKVFKKVVGFVGKIASSKWGKVLMIAAAIYTGGAALAAGFPSVATTASGFMSKFVAGSKAFMGALTGAGAPAVAPVAGAGVTGATTAATGVAGAAGAIPAAAAAVPAAAAAPAATTAATLGTGGGTAALGTGTAGVTGAVPGAVPGAVAGAAPAAAGGGGIGGMLMKGAKAAYGLANSPIGQAVISQGLQGYAAGKQQEEENARRDEVLYGSRRDMGQAGQWGNVGRFEYNQPA